MLLTRPSWTISAYFVTNLNSSLNFKHMSWTKLKTFVCIIVCTTIKRTADAWTTYVSCTKPQTALIKLCSVYTSLVVTILIHMYCTVHCLICNYHQLEMIINSLAMADGSSNDFKILMNYQSCIAKLITNLLKYYHWNFRWNSTHFCRLVFIDSYASKNFR